MRGTGACKRVICVFFGSCSLKLPFYFPSISVYFHLFPFHFLNFDIFFFHLLVSLFSAPPKQRLLAT